MPRPPLTAPGVPAPLDGFDYPAPRFPRYLLQERTDDIEELMPLARAHVRRRYGRSALGDVQPGDELLIVTFPHQKEIVFEALRRALLEIGVAKVDRIDVTDLGMETTQYSAADGWREITDRLPPMIEEGVEFNVAAAALKRFLDDRPGYTGVYAGEAGRSHWKRAAGKRIRNNWVYSTYEDFVGRANGVPDEVWRTVDLMVVDAFRNAAAVRITSPEGTDIGWEVTEQQAELWPQGAYISGHILGSTIQGIRFGHPVETFLREAQILMPTLNGVIGGTTNHTGYYPHVQVTVESGMIAHIEGGGRYGDLWREVVERYRDTQYPGFPYRAGPTSTTLDRHEPEELPADRDAVELQRLVDQPAGAGPGRGHPLRLRCRALGQDIPRLREVEQAADHALPARAQPVRHLRDQAAGHRRVGEAHRQGPDRRAGPPAGGPAGQQPRRRPPPRVRLDPGAAGDQLPRRLPERLRAGPGGLDPARAGRGVRPWLTSDGATPFYLPVGDEVELFQAAYEQRIPVLLKGPTGCGKTRFVEHMAWRIAREREQPVDEPLVTVTCHDDMTAADLVGRYLLSADGTRWLDGPLTRPSGPGRSATWTRSSRRARTPR